MRSTIAVAGLVAFGAVLLAPAQSSDGERQLSLHGQRKLTDGALLGFVPGSGPTIPTTLARIDPKTLRPTAKGSLRLPFADAWAVSPSGSTLALAVHPEPVNEPNSLELVDLPSLRRRGPPLALGGDVSALAWTSPHEIVALVGNLLCCPAQLHVEIADLLTRHVRRRALPGTVLRIERSPRGLVLLTAPSGAIGRASLSVADARGVRTTRLGSIRVGEVPGDGSISEWRLPGLAVDYAGRHAYVVGPGGTVAQVDLATLATSSHRLSKRRSLLASIDGWLEPLASAKGDRGPVRRAQWVGNGFLLVAGSDNHDTERRLASDPSGLRLIDTRNWTVHVLAPRADSFTLAEGLLLATGARWRGNVDPTGMGLAAYGPDGKRRFALFAGRDVWIDTVANRRAYVGVYGQKRLRVVDLASGRVVGRAAPVPILLLGPGSVR